VKVAEGSKAMATLQGFLLLKGTKGGLPQLDNVLVVPTLHKNILSASKILHDIKNFVTGTKDKLELKPENSSLEMTRDPSSGLWFFQATRAPILELNTLKKTTIVP
jgi:hypothetical protein